MKDISPSVVYKTATRGTFFQRRDIPRILVVTATQVETSALHREMQPLPGAIGIVKIAENSRVYYVGILGRHAIIHVQSEMGSVQRDSSALTTYDAISTWKIRAVIMLGIAFGISRRTQTIGDVLVARTLLPYDVKREGRKATVHRGIPPVSGTVLFNRFTNCPEWRHELKQDRFASILPGDLLSGETLVDNIALRKRLTKNFPTAIGGEMEGIGVSSAASSQRVEWILAKAICDFADGAKKYAKKKRQQVAAKSAACLCRHVLSTEGILDPLGINCQAAVVDLSGSRSFEEAPADPLFTVLTPRDLSLAHQRAIDLEISHRFPLQNIWLWGPPGSGKSTSIRMLLFTQTTDFAAVDLSPGIGFNGARLFHILGEEMVAQLKLNANPTAGTSYTPRYLANLAIAQLEVKPLLLFIDEIPLEGGVGLQEFAALVFELTTIVIQSSPRYPLRIVVASHVDTSFSQAAFSMRFRERFITVQHPPWTIRELTKLAESIVPHLKPRPSSPLITRFAKSAQSCPRIFKQLLRNWLTLHSEPNFNLSLMISETTAEFTP